MYDWIFCPKKPVKVEPALIHYDAVVIPYGPNGVRIPESEYYDNYTGIGNYLEKLQDVVEPNARYTNCIVKVKDKNDFSYILYYDYDDESGYCCDWDFDEGQGPFYIVSIVPTKIANTLAQYFANDYADVGVCPDIDELPRIFTEEDLK